MIARPLVIGMLSYGIARLANPDASSWRTMAITLAIFALMFINDVWREVIRERMIRAALRGRINVH